MNLRDELNQLIKTQIAKHWDEITKTLVDLMKERSKAGWGYITVAVFTKSAEDQLISWGSEQGLDCSAVSCGFLSRGVLMQWDYGPFLMSDANATLLNDGTLKIKTTAPESTPP